MKRIVEVRIEVLTTVDDGPRLSKADIFKQTFYDTSDDDTIVDLSVECERALRRLIPGIE